MSKSRKRMWVINIVLLDVLFAVTLYAFIIQPNQRKAQRLESCRSELNYTTQIGTDLCGDRLNHKDSAIFNHTRDTFRMHQGMLLAQYNMAYDDMMSYDMPNALLCTNILYDALGNNSRSMEAVLKEIEADDRTQEAAALIQQMTE